MYQFENKEYMTANELADKLGVNVRTVQKWAKDGKIPGAILNGRLWLIPDSICYDGKAFSNTRTDEPLCVPLPLLCSSFPVGRCFEYINIIENQYERNIAMAEYYYYIGDVEKTVEYAEGYLGAEDLNIMYSAGVVCTFANIFSGHMRLANLISELITHELQTDKALSREFEAFSALVANIGDIILDIPFDTVPDLYKHIPYLPDGLKVYACYLLAYQAYNQKNYEKALAICKLSFSFAREFYPIASVYVYMVATASSVMLKNTIDGKRYYMQAWDIVYKDKLFGLFATHHKILHGYNELYIKREYPAEYKIMLSIIKDFNEGWRKLHKVDEYNFVHTLTPTEISIAILYNRNWTASDISKHMDLSERTVKNYIRYLYEKLGINKKSELKQFLNW